MKITQVQSMTEGNISKQLLSFTLPMLLGNLFQQFYNMVDSIVVGNYVSSDALGAVGATGSVNFLFFSLCSGMAVGIGIIVAQYFGAKDHEAVIRAIANGAYVLIACALIMSTIAFTFAPQILRLLETPEGIIQDSITYMRLCSLGILSIAIYNGVSAILRALGDSKTPLIFLIIASVVNVILDLLFVLGFHWDVFGVGLATILSQTASAIGSTIYAFCKVPYFRINREQRRPRHSEIIKTLHIGLPIAFQTSLIAISCIVLQRVVNGFMEDVIAANTAVSRLEQLVQQPYSSLGMAVSAFTGQNIGAGRIDRVKKCFWLSTLYVGIFSLIMLVLAQFCGGFMIGIFVDEQEVIDIGAHALKITSCFYFWLGMIYVARSILNGAGDSGYALINGFMELAGRVGFARPFTMIPSIGVWGIFLTTGCTWFITGVASIIRYATGKWKNKSIVAQG